MLRARAARREDYAAYTRFWGELNTGQPVFDVERWDEHYRPHTLFLESEGGAPAAYALVMPFGERGDVRQIVVDPAWRGRGVGRQLMAIVADRLRETGCTHWRLEVRAANAPAIALYERVGMSVVREIEIFHLPRADVERFAATRSGTLRVERVVDTSHDRELETRFDLGAGQLARFRTARPQAVMLQIPGAALTHYTRSFAPDSGLAFPFRAPDADHAAHLLAEVHALGVPAQLELCVVDRPVAAALRAAGAQPTEHQLEMGGPL